MSPSQQHVARNKPVATQSRVTRAVLQRTCACGSHTGGSGECESCKKKTEGQLQRRASSEASLWREATAAPEIVHDVLHSTGHPLDRDTRSFMESRFGHDFSGVRLHTDDKAAASASAVDADAYTVGRQIVFGRGSYSPHTTTGRRLLAHELTHVVQQRGSETPASGGLQVGSATDRSEQEAEQVAEFAISNSQSSNRTFASSRFAHDFTGVLQRQAIHDESASEAASEEENEAAPAGAVMEWRDIDVAGVAIEMGADGGTGATELQSDAGAGPSERSSDAGTRSDAGTEGGTDGGTSQTDGGGGNSGGTSAGCTPQPLNRATYLSRPGATTGDFGLTRLAGQVGVPVVQVTNGRLQQTGAQMAPLTSVYTQGTFVEGQEHYTSQGGTDCPTGTYPIQWTIAGTGEAKIIEGEREHCTDFALAFDLSLNRFAQAVNAAAQAGRRFASQQAAERFFQNQVGVAPANWFDHFNCLAQKTKRRDDSGAHTPVGVGRGSIPPTYPCDQAKRRVILREMHLPRIPGSASSSLITPAGCPV